MLLKILLALRDVKSISYFESVEFLAYFTGLVSCFLHVHPNGASVDYIWSYLSQLNVSTRTSELEELLLRLPMLFKLNMSGVGAGIEKKWQFVAYSNTAFIPFSFNS